VCRFYWTFSARGNGRMYEPETLDVSLQIWMITFWSIADEGWLVLEKQVKTSTMDYVVTKPDIMCLSKALTGGNSMAITTFTQDIFEAMMMILIRHCFTDTPLQQILRVSSCSSQFRVVKHSRCKLIWFRESKSSWFRVKRMDTKVTTTRVLGTIFALEIKTGWG
jgi:adenosylmethionine-8-amino-7-oxononanoate aminotransferase